MRSHSLAALCRATPRRPESISRACGARPSMCCSLHAASLSSQNCIQEKYKRYIKPYSIIESDFGQTKFNLRFQYLTVNLNFCFRRTSAPSSQSNTLQQSLNYNYESSSNTFTQVDKKQQQANAKKFVYSLYWSHHL